MRDKLYTLAFLTMFGFSNQLYSQSQDSSKVITDTHIIEKHDVLLKKKDYVLDKADIYLDPIKVVQNFDKYTKEDKELVLDELSKYIISQKENFEVKTSQIVQEYESKLEKLKITKNNKIKSLENKIELLEGKGLPEKVAKQKEEIQLLKEEYDALEKEYRNFRKECETKN